MGIYVNPGLASYRIDRNDEYYVDKSGMISILNKKIDTADRFVCVSRPRRFGKTMAARMLAAYYSKGCDSSPLFASMAVSTDPSYLSHLNKYTVIRMDLNGALTTKGGRSVAEFYSDEIIPELMEEFPNVSITRGTPLAKAIAGIYKECGERFVIIIDEYDVIMRDPSYSIELESYMGFLVSLFKNEDVAPAIALAYITGILPIIKEKTQSKLNAFTQYSFIKARELAPFMGFTEEETRKLCERSGLTFSEVKRWYDGYRIDGMDIYSPRSVISSVKEKSCEDYWTETSSFEALRDYVIMDLDGIKEDIISMISGDEVEVDTSKFMNDPFSVRDKDEAFTCLIHLGYLSYDKERASCFIPNHEVKMEWVRAMNTSPDYRRVMETVKASRKLLEATWRMDEVEVGKALEEAHMLLTSNLSYNNEQSFQSAIRLSYFYADSFYTIVNELPAGKGYADVAFIPFVPDKSAIIIELKMENTTESAIEQIKKKEYPKALEKYKGNIILVGVTYKKDKKHICRIEKA